MIGKKIVIVGSSGCGKTTFARKLSDKTGTPHIEIDYLFWKPDWVQTSDEEFRPLVDKASSADKWIIDGNYKRVQDLTVWRADTIIWLDTGFVKVMFRVILRTLKRLIDRKPLWHNNRESLRMALSKDSIILYTFTHYKSKRRWNSGLMNKKELKHLNRIRISGKKEEKRFWGSLS